MAKLLAELTNEGKRVIDVSQWNVGTNMAAAKADGVDAAIVKLALKYGQPDPRLDAHCTGFKAAGIPVIAGYDYCYSPTVASAQPKAVKCMELCKKYGIPKFELDLEDTCMRGIGKTMVDIVNVYRKEAEAAGLAFGIYTGAGFYNPYMAAYKSAWEGIPFWWARYPYVTERRVRDAVPSIKSLPKDLLLDGWQFSSNTIINGFQGRIDLSVWWSDLNPGGYNPTPEEEIISPDIIPYKEPINNVTKGDRGEGVKWVQWVVWRCGCFLDANGVPDKSQIDGIFGPKTEAGVKEVQRRLGMAQTGIVKAVDRSIWKKLF